MFLVTNKFDFMWFDLMLMFNLMPVSLPTAMNCGRCPAFDTDNMFIVAVSDTGTNNIFHVEYETGVTRQLLVHDERAHPYLSLIHI